MGSVYTLIPRPVAIFAGLDMTSRYAFGLIYDRWLLSNKAGNKERFTDRYGVYCVFSREAMAAEMGVSLPTLRKALQPLYERGLVIARLPISGGPWRYYVTSEAEDEILSVVEDLPTAYEIAMITERIERMKAQETP